MILQLGGEESEVTQKLNEKRERKTEQMQHT